MWAQEQKNTFDDLKTALTTAAVSGYPDFNQTFYQTTDASKPAVDWILSQCQEGKERPTAYASRQLNQHKQRWVKWAVAARTSSGPEISEIICMVISSSDGH